GALIINVGFVGTVSADFFGVGNAEENAAVGGVVCPEFGVDLEIFVGLLADQMSALALVGNQRVTFNTPVGIADGIKIVLTLALVDCRDPARGRAVSATGGQQSGRSQCNRMQSFHFFFSHISGDRTIVRNGD